MNETEISSPISAIKIQNGIRVIRAVIAPDVNIGARNPERILSRVCPATVLANSRTPSEKARARYEISSIGTSRGTSHRGVPEGTKNEKKCTLCSCRPRIVTPMKIVILRPILTIIDVATVNPYGTLPLRFAIRIKKNRE